MRSPLQVCHSVSWSACTYRSGKELGADARLLKATAEKAAVYAFIFPNLMINRYGCGQLIQKAAPK
jgi:hypothetical protein